MSALIYKLLKASIILLSKTFQIKTMQNKEENQCVAEIHKTVSKHPVAVVVAYVSKQELEHAMDVYEKAQVPVPAYELHADGPDDPCLEEIPDVEKFPTFYVYKDGVKVGKVELTGDVNKDAEAFKKALNVPNGSKYKYMGVEK